MKVKDKNVEKTLIKVRYELGCATNSRPDAYTRMKIEKIINRVSETCVTKQQQKAKIHMIKVREGEKKEEVWLNNIQ